MRVFFVFSFVIMLAQNAWAQLVSDTLDTFIYHPCPPATLPVIYPDDSLSQKGSAIDSLYALMQGRWKLIVTGGGWGHPRKPKKKTEIYFDQRGKGKVYEDGVLVSTMHIMLKRVYRMLLFDVEDQGKLLFSFSPQRNSNKKKGSMAICEVKMSLFSGADGPAYAFRKVL